MQFLIIDTAEYLHTMMSPLKDKTNTGGPQQKREK